MSLNLTSFHVAGWGSSRTFDHKGLVTDKDPRSRNVLLLPIPAMQRLVKFMFIL